MTVEDVLPGEVSYVSIARLLASDPDTVAKLEADVPHFPNWRLDITFESLADLLAADGGATWALERDLVPEAGLIYNTPKPVERSRGGALDRRLRPPRISKNNPEKSYPSISAMKKTGTSIP